MSFRSLFSSWEDYAVGLVILAVVSVPIAVIWTVVHFIRKWW